MNNYAVVWVEYRRSREDVLLAWILYVPWVGAFAFASSQVVDTIIPDFVAAAAGMLWLLNTSARLQHFRCPRCGESFADHPAAFELQTWMFCRNCRHCGLRKFSMR